MNVLIATDGSEPALAAIRFFSRLPHAEPHDVTVLTVAHVPDVPPGAAVGPWYSSYLESQEQEAGRNYAAAAACFEGANATVKHVRSQGHAGHEVVRKAKEMGADLVVLGAKGHSVVDRILLGSVSDHVATHATCSVLVVRPPQGDRDSTPNPRVLIPFDGSPPSQYALRYFVNFGWSPGLDVELFSILPLLRVMPRSLEQVAIPVDSGQREQIQTALDAAVKKLKNKKFSVTGTLVEAEHIGERIVGHAEESRPDLIVMGDTGRGAISRILLGSASRYVLRHAIPSVWIVRRKKK